MDIIKQPFGEYLTNAYILKFGAFEFAIDPGYGSAKWILKHTSNLKAILITHGHFDHIWDTAILQQATQAKVYCPKQDSFMLESDCFNLGLTPCKANVYIEHYKTNTTFDIHNIKVTYWHFPGHTPGCSIIEINNHFFTGDFIFYRSIGRYDFPYSNPLDMKDSLERFLKIDNNFPIHPGHGEDTYVQTEQKNIPSWIKYIDV